MYVLEIKKNFGHTDNGFLFFLFYHMIINISDGVEKQNASQLSFVVNRADRILVFQRQLFI